jgi:hypothetical protein
MTHDEIMRRRLGNQRLVGKPFASAAEAVRALVAVQAQDFAGAKWGVGQRVRDATEADLDRAYNEGAILRTHVMRPTWHFVLPEDIRWLQALTSPRVHALNAYQNRQLELDAAEHRKSARVLTKALRDGNYMTRAEIGAAYQAAGIEATGLRLAYLVMHAELNALICSGPLRGKQFTYALVDERAPSARTMGREESLAELAMRFFSRHGPARVQDLAWWSGLTVIDAKAGVALAGSTLQSEVVGGETYWFGADSRPPRASTARPHLLPNYDEYLIAYRDSSGVLDRERFPEVTTVDLSNHFVVWDGRIVGGWQRNLAGGEISVRLRLFGEFGVDAIRAIESELRRYEGFVGQRVVVVW